MGKAMTPYEYAMLLSLAGAEEREVARAYYYAVEFGVPEGINDECLEFREPICGDWNCISPTHQVLTLA